MEKSMMLDIKPAKLTGGVGSWKTFEMSTTITTGSSSQGAAVTAYGCQPVQFLRDAIEAAKEKMIFLQLFGQYQLPNNMAQIAIPYMTKQLAASSWETSTAEYAAGNEIAWTQLSNNSNVNLALETYNYGVGLSNKNLRTNALNLLKFSQDQLSYNFENAIDSAIRAAIVGTPNASSGSVVQGAAAMSNTVAGMQTIFGGDATNAANNLDAGDILTTDIIAKAKRLLQSSAGYWWSSNVWTKSAFSKNPWASDRMEPFVLVIAPEQEEALCKDSQFVSAAEYGGREVVLNGEIGALPYLGVKIISTTKCSPWNAADYIEHQASTLAEDVAGHQCVMVKAMKIGALAWGRKAELKVFDWPNADQIRMKLSFDYACDTIYNDAAVKIVVADE